MPFAKGFGIWELLIILAIIMIIFGVGRLPEIGGYLGKGIREFKKGQNTDQQDEQGSEAKTEAAQEKQAQP